MKYSENNYVHKTPVQIRFNDADVVGHINNVVYQHYYDLAKLEYFNEVLGRNVDWKKTSMVQATINIDYFEPIYLEDKIIVLTKVTEIGNKSLKLTQEIITVDAVLKSSNNCVMVGFDYESRQSVVVPEEWKKKIAAYEKHVKFKYTKSL